MADDPPSYLNLSFPCSEVSTVSSLTTDKPYRRNSNNAPVPGEELGRSPHPGSTAQYIDKAIQGTRLSIALRGNQLIRLAISQLLACV